jgi:hypothetical protein
MKSFITNVMQTVAMIALFSIAAFMAPAEAKEPRVEQIKVEGRTPDGKYPIYVLQGDIDGSNVFTETTAYQPQQLAGKIAYVKKEDQGKGPGKYECDWLCKDTVGHIVGMPEAMKVWEPKKTK